MSWRSLFQNLTSFQKTLIVTICVTFLLIFIGGLVRATGAGLGCPDWPRCFGLWVPPVNAADLPAGYDPEQFNVFKTWMEYVNRLFGVLVGFLILLTFIMSFRYIRTSRAVFAGSTSAFVLVLYQGWLGGQVVQSGLESWMISVHMVVAVLILNTLLWTLFQSMRDRIRFKIPDEQRRKLLVILSVLILATVVQIVFGTQVREGLESVKAAYPALDRGSWLNEVGVIDSIHRSFSWLVLALVIAFHYMVRYSDCGPYLPLLAILTTTGTLVQILLGTGLVYLAIPPAFQLLHLWLAVFLAAVPFLALLLVLHAGNETYDINHDSVSPPR